MSLSLFEVAAAIALAVERKSHLIAKHALQRHDEEFSGELRGWIPFHGHVEWKNEHPMFGKKGHVRVFKPESNDVSPAVMGEILFALPRVQGAHLVIIVCDEELDYERHVSWFHKADNVCVVGVTCAELAKRVSEMRETNVEPVFLSSEEEESDDDEADESEDEEDEPSEEYDEEEGSDDDDDDL